MSGFSRREVCLGLAATGFLSPAGAAAAPYDAVVRRSGGTHSSLGAALSSAPPGEAPYRILLGAGRWEEKLTIARPNVALIGEDRRRTILTSAIASGHAKPAGGTYGTFGSATLTAEAPGFSARTLTIENGFDYVANLRSRAIADAQAVALAFGFGADRMRIENVELLGHQDTFYLRGGRASVRNCLIAGGVDFIFGGAAALFEGCEIRSRLRPGEPLQGYVAAPSTPREQPYGLVFANCRLTREAGVPPASVWLGRPWRAGGNLGLRGAAAYLDCWMDAHIHPEGWTWMGYKGPGGYAMRFEPGDARFFEYQSPGPGARRNRARSQLSMAEARAHSSLLGDWKP
ncbi:pectinesterase family protein [Allosphingosinicella deserti]|uniref:pectinesterase family protein n=1 Tax=Allosphingosinicella deserti TaxID=2116704 RepID=UPI0013048F5D|nr:pectinesterase family protein [Sphingomonas deserti]